MLVKNLVSVPGPPLSKILDPRLHGGLIFALSGRTKPPFSGLSHPTNIPGSRPTKLKKYIHVQARIQGGGARGPCPPPHKTNPPQTIYGSTIVRSGSRGGGPRGPWPPPYTILDPPMMYENLFSYIFYFPSYSIFLRFCTLGNTYCKGLRSHTLF